ncbi:MAG: sugar MFS transporter [Bryobacteraceae bacterium]
MTQTKTGVRTSVSTGTVLAGFFLSGFLFAFPGAILPAWGAHRDPPAFLTVGNYFLCLAAGMVLAGWIFQRLLRWGVPVLLGTASLLGCGALLYLAAVSPPAAAAWRMPGLAVLGLAGGLLTTGLFHGASAGYHDDPARSVIVGGLLYGLGCLAATLAVAGTFYAYTVPSMLILMAAVPGLYAGVFFRAQIPAADPAGQPSLRQALRDFRSPGAVLFALLLFFQFGNEWALAGWLPLFVIRRLGASPKVALTILALYWLALLVGRGVAVYLLPRVRHGRILVQSVLAAIFGVLLLYSTNNAFGAGVGAVVVGCGFAAIYPLVAEKIGRRFPYFHPAFFSGIFTLAGLGGLLAPATLGYYAHFAGIGVVMALPALGTWMVLALLLLIWLETRLSGQ